MLRAVCVLVLLSASSAVRPASFGRRGPPRLLATDGDDCTFGGLCTGPSGGVYAVAPGDVYEAVFVVPPLPAIFDLGMTYYVSPGEEVPRECREAVGPAGCWKGSWPVGPHGAPGRPKVLG